MSKYNLRKRRGCDDIDGRSKSKRKLHLSPSDSSDSAEFDLKMNRSVDLSEQSEDLSEERPTRFHSYNHHDDITSNDDDELDDLFDPCTDESYFKLDSALLVEHIIHNITSR